VSAGKKKEERRKKERGWRDGGIEGLRGCVYSWRGVGKVEPGPEIFFFGSGPGSTFNPDSAFCIC